MNIKYIYYLVRKVQCFFVFFVSAIKKIYEEYTANHNGKIGTKINTKMNTNTGKNKYTNTT